MSTVAGRGKSGYGGDGGPAAMAELVEPNGVCLDGKGTLYIADVRGQRVRAVDLQAGTIRTAVGTGRKASDGDGPLPAASLNGPRAVAVDPAGRLLVVEREGNCVRRVDFARGTIERFAGTGKKGYTGDGGPALAATFDGPKEIAVGPDGSVYVVDTENEAIRRVDPAGVVTTVAGKGRTKTPGLGDGGPATDATLGRPHGVAVGPDGAVYIADTLSHRIRRVK
jgi:sugar lactone lactonase YvrE